MGGTACVEAAFYKSAFVTGINRVASLRYSVSSTFRAGAGANYDIAIGTRLW